MVNVVRDKDHAESARPRLRDVAQDDAGFLDTERGRRLVEDQDLAPK